MSPGELLPGEKLRAPSILQAEIYIWKVAGEFQLVPCGVCEACNRSPEYSRLREKNVRRRGCEAEITSGPIAGLVGAVERVQSLNRKGGFHFNGGGRRGGNSRPVCGSNEPLAKGQFPAVK